MKFKVRTGFVVHLTTVKTVAGEKQETTSTYSEGEELNIGEAEARLHLHKLEPADPAAKKFVDGFVLPNTPAEAAPAAGVDQAAIAAGVTDALIKAGLVKAPEEAKK